jgi:hypothetical protein
MEKDIPGGLMPNDTLPPSTVVVEPPPAEPTDYNEKQEKTE